MEIYNAPLEDIRFLLQHLEEEQDIEVDATTEPMFDRELTDAILEESARFASEVLFPLNNIGDLEGVSWSVSGVTMPEGFKDAYDQLINSEWNKISTPVEYGGQGFPKRLSTAVREIFSSANKSFVMCPDLTAAAIEALSLAADDSLKNTYLPKLVEGKWSATMNLTEPQAGSDVSALRSRAMPQEDGTYRVFGQKIFISFGDHDLTENIVHLVLARTMGAQKDAHGISLFLVPKYLPDADNNWTIANDVVCTGIEHKLGNHASPTCTLVFGDEGKGAVGWLIGEELKGLQYMFIMMNSARFKVGMESIAVSELSYQQALSYAKERIQGKAVSGGHESVAIFHHPDVSRMLLSMRSRIDAMRSLGYWISSQQDAIHLMADQDRARQNAALIDLMIPIFKGWATETSVAVTATSVQIHGGMGYITESGASQPLRDVLICPIYEGTTGIQANDLISRKIIRDGGSSLNLWLEKMQHSQQRLVNEGGDDLSEYAAQFNQAIHSLKRATDWIIANYTDSTAEVLAVSVPFLQLAGIVAGGWQMADTSLSAKRLYKKGDISEEFVKKKMVNLGFYSAQVLSLTEGLAHSVMYGGMGALDFEMEISRTA